MLSYAKAFRMPSRILPDSSMLSGFLFSDFPFFAFVTLATEMCMRYDHADSSADSYNTLDPMQLHSMHHFIDMRTCRPKRGRPKMDSIKLNTGTFMPMEGFGVFRVPDKEECRRSVLEAIRIGYRLIDTAAVYTNEDAVGEAVRQAINEGICTREELFITSKLWVTDMRNEDTARRAIDTSLRKSGLDYFDLYLVHQALADYFAGWRAMEEAYHDGRLKAIGVSNFYPNILTNFCETVNVIPAVNQVELHPWYVQAGALETMKHYGVVPEAWAPLGGGRYTFEDTVLTAIAAAHSKTVGQVMLRWNVQRGVVVIPKSTHVERIRENLDIWDFTLAEDEMNAIASLDMGYTGSRAKHFDPAFVRQCFGKK